MTVPSGPARRIRHWVLLVVLIWAALAYVMAPRLWTHHGEQPGIRPLPKVTLTARGLPGDPMDVGLVGTRDDVVRAMAAAGWHAAAPAGQLSYAGRLPDLAFEAESVDPAGRRAIVALLSKAEASKSATLRGYRHTMLDDSDISPTRHARAFVCGALASVVGHAEIYVSGGAEHQGPDGGGPVALIVDRTAIRR